VHDDVEDDSDERRGEPTLHRQVGKPLAINAGDGLHAYMWQLLLDDRGLPREVLAEFLWLIHRTAEGQHLDLAWVARGRFDVSEAEYLEMVRLKTACYTVVSPLRLGALCAGRTPDPLLREAGEELGVAFQIRDDVLNLTPGMQQGKEFAGDLFEGKRTLILAHFFAHATAAAGREASRRLSGVRRHRTAEDVEALLGMLDEHGSLAYAQGVAEARAERGLGLLRRALAAAPDGEAVVQLMTLLESLASRRS
jgi:geranylgeranyl diphosphate synthase type II